MEPNVKLLIEEMLKQVREEIQVMRVEMKEGFVVHESFVNNRIAEFAVAEEQHEERVAVLETMTTDLSTWKPEIESSITLVKLKLSKLKSFFASDVKNPSTTQAGVLQLKSASEHSPVGFPADGPHGHRVDMNHRASGFGQVYTQIHDPVKGTSCHPPPPPKLSPQLEFSGSRDFFQSPNTPSQSPRVNTGKLPKLNFPKFDGDNPKLWKSHCENYFEMYSVESNVWVKVASMHFEGPAPRWLQSVDHRVCTATCSELCSWIHERFGRDQHEILIRKLYRIKQTGPVQEYIDKFCELVDQLQAYSSSVDPLYYTTRFIDGLRDDIKSVIIVQRPPNLDIVCCMALLQEETVVAPMKEVKKYDPAFSRPYARGPLPLPRPPEGKSGAAPDDKLKAGPKGQSIEEKMAALTAYCMAKGLCKKCGKNGT
jgi:hypothetical protein